MTLESNILLRTFFGVFLEILEEMSDLMSTAFTWYAKINLLLPERMLKQQECYLGLALAPSNGVIPSVAEHCLASSFSTLCQVYPVISLK